MRIRHRQSRLVVHAALALCCAVALGALLISSARRSERTDDAHGLSPRLSDVVAAVGDRPAIDASSDSFLDDLSGAASAQRSNAAASGEPTGITASWHERVGLVELAEKVLRAYKDESSSELVSSGYMDIEGNVWAALVCDPHGWVDIVTIASGPDDSASEARVIRLLAGDGIEQGDR